MQAIVQEGYGSPDVLRLREIDTPRINDDQVLVKVHAASVNALDWHITRGMPYVLRLGLGLRKPSDKIRGVDLAGRVVAVGKNVQRVKPGDDVFGGADGTFAEYAATIEERLAIKPAQLTYEQAATLNVAGLTALQGLRKAQLQAGQRVLVNGAGGGVGTFAVQVAKSLGAHVTAVTRTESVELVRSIGADEVIDHAREDFTRRDEQYDVLYDIGGRQSFADCRRVMTRNGTMIVIGAPAARWIAPVTRLAAASIVTFFGTQRIIPFVAHKDHASLAHLGALTQSGQLTPVIDRRYELSETAEALAHVGAGRARGKVVIAIA